MNLKNELRLGNYIKQKGHKEHLKVMAILEHDVIVGDGGVGKMLSWEEVEPILANEKDYEFFDVQIRDFKNPFVPKHKYIHGLQNYCFLLTNRELYS